MDDFVSRHGNAFEIETDKACIILSTFRRGEDLECFIHIYDLADFELIDNFRKFIKPNDLPKLIRSLYFSYSSLAEADDEEDFL